MYILIVRGSRTTCFPCGDSEKSLVSLTLCAAVHWGDGIWLLLRLFLFHLWRFVHSAAAGRVVCIFQLSERGVSIKELCQRVKLCTRIWMQTRFKQELLWRKNSLFSNPLSFTSNLNCYHMTCHALNNQKRY